jgi:arylsulfatase B
MWLAYNAPHGPLQAKPEDLAAVGFDPSKPRFPAGRAAREAAGYGDEGRGNTHRQTALAMIHGLDRGVGAVLDALEQTGQLDNTIILFTSDNGGPSPWKPKSPDEVPSSNGPLRGWKFQHYEGGVRLAAAFAWPGHLKPRADADMGSMAYVDLLPTIAHFAHAPLTRPVDGEDVSASILTGKRIAPRTIFLGEDYRIPAAEGERGPTDPEALRGRAASAIVGRWKLVGDMLFDVDADPYEQHDVAAQHPAEVRMVKQQIAKYVALRRVPRERMNATHLPPIPLWELPPPAK